MCIRNLCLLMRGIIILPSAETRLDAGIKRSANVKNDLDPLGTITPNTSFPKVL